MAYPPRLEPLNLAAEEYLAATQLKKQNPLCSCQDTKSIIVDNYEAGKEGGAVAMKTIVLGIEEEASPGPSTGLQCLGVQPWFSTLNFKERKMFLESLDLAAASHCF